MKDFLIKILKVVLVIAAVALFALLVFGVVLFMDWPWWTGIFILLGLAGLWAGILFTRKILLRRREQHFVQQIIAQDQAYLEHAPDSEKDQLRELQQSWKEAIRTLKKSHLRKLGNPLYVLPWYMVIGESGSGKTTAIKGARLSSSFADTVKISGISGTRNCDWWFFEQAVILDTAGRYAIPVEPGRDREEWQKFLSLLAKYRKKEPINGLVVSVSADKLLTGSRDALERDGAEIRKRIDELMRALGVKFPIYIMVTKCDLIQGMSAFCEKLPESVLDQAMGLRNEDGAETADSFAAKAVEYTSERLRDLRLLLLGSMRSKETASGFLLFPEEFEGIKPGLQAFARGAFAPNPYQETPVLKGIYFSSGRQEGTPYSHFLHSLGLIKKQEVLPGTSRGLFLHDFFAKVLPADRSLLAPTRKNLEWQSITRNLGLASWVALGIALCGLLSFSFVKNLWSLREVSREFSSPPAITGEALQDIMTLSHFRAALTRVENDNRGWWIPRFGLNESLQVEEKLKERYCSWFHDLFLKPTDSKIALELSGFSSQTPDDILAAYLPYVVRRINLSQAWLSGKSADELADMPLPGITPGLPGLENVPVEEIQDRLNQLFVYYLAWNGNRDQVSKETAALKAWLRHLFSQNRLHLHWIVTWINGYSGIQPVTLGKFWGGTSPEGQEPVVMPAFTKKGNELRLAFLRELSHALEDPLLIAQQEKELDDWYVEQYQISWLDFASHFSQGAYRLKTREDWQQTAMRMAQNSNPYLDFLQELAVQIEPVLHSGNRQAWTNVVFRIAAMRQMAAQQAGIAKAKGAISCITKKGQKLLGVINKEASKRAVSGTEEQLKAVKAFREYMKHLADAASIITSRSKAFKTSAEIFSGGDADENNEILSALNSVLQIKTLLGRGGISEESVWRLLQGPADFIWSYVCLEAACYLQGRWEQDILSEMQGPADWMNLKGMLLGEQGKVWRFVKGIAGPFIGWQPGKGYFAREVMGAQIPFRAEFFTFLNKSAAGKSSARDSYDVYIKALPTDVNVDASFKPHETRLELQCSSGTQKLVNLNYPVDRRFKWQPSSCGDVMLKISIGNLVLTKIYQGYDGFPRFLNDFRDGQHVFYPGDFPEQEEALKRMNIQFIKVQYQFNGSMPVLRLLQGTPGKIPEKIVICWD